jgi:hypothetical protein
MASNDHHSDLHKERVRIAESTLSRQLEWVSRADSKSSFTAGLSTAMLGALATVATRPSEWPAPLAVMVASVIVLLAASLFSTYWASYPRLDGPQDSLIFFGTMAAKHFAKFQQQFVAATPESYLDDLLHQCHRNAVIADTKYRHLKGAYKLISLSLVPWALAIWIFRSMGH